jgi:lysozyme
LSDNGVKILQSLEGYSSVSYLDVAGVKTIGYGRTHHIKDGEITTREIEVEWLKKEAQEAADFLAREVEVPLTQNQADALIIWIYNVGRGAALKSTLLRVLNQGHYSQVPGQLRRWNRAGGRVVKGLVNRRAQEVALWNGGKT